MLFYGYKLLKVTNYIIFQTFFSLTQSLQEKDSRATHETLYIELHHLMREYGAIRSQQHNHTDAPDTFKHMFSVLELRVGAKCLCPVLLEHFTFHPALNKKKKSHPSVCVCVCIQKLLNTQTSAERHRDCLNMWFTYV